MEHIPLHRRTRLLEWGIGSAEIARCIDDGLLLRVRPGIFAVGEAWHASTREQKVVARARALALASASPPLFSHETAAALHGLPLYSPDPRRVHVILDAARHGAALDTIRHRGELAAEDLTSRQGLACTSLPRTVADIARTASFERAATVADAALRRVGMTDASHYDTDRAGEFVEDVLSIARRSAHGRSRAERVLRFADGRAELPGESISRIRLAALGFRRIRLQVRVPAPAGKNDYRVDFGIDDVPALGEFDGRIKYEDGRILLGRTPDEVFDEEKQREDWIRGTTGLPLVRWGWPHLKTAEDLAVRLAAFGIRPPS